MQVNIGGVPEHFNFPFHHAIIAKAKSDLGITLQWQDYPGGTGAMCADLESNTLDIAIVLTEGIIAAISKGNPSKIIQWYVESPLVWGIHVNSNSSIFNEVDFANKKYAISRPGSGSHLMAYVDANNRGLQLKETDFVVVGNLNGAVQALEAYEADLFMWEKFTTKPLVDNGAFRRVAECPTPWPCFAIAVSNLALEKHPDVIAKLIALVTQVNSEMKAIENLNELIAEKYGLKVEDVTSWLSSVQWKSDNTQVDPLIITGIIENLTKLHIIDNPILAASVLYQW